VRLFDRAQREDSIHRSKAVGEPPLLLAFSVFFAIRDAVAAAMLVEVIEARGSVPRGTGTRMLVNAHGVAGTIGGGHLELQSIALARERLAAANAEPLDWVVALGPSLGQCCGGTLTLRLQALTPALVQVWPTTRPLFRLHLFRRRPCGSGAGQRAGGSALRGLLGR
jgi:xanthine/CO dehydrogenase XdhC/CoxF family maturation factor